MAEAQLHRARSQGSSSPSSNWPEKVVEREAVAALSPLKRQIAEHYIKIGKWAYADAGNDSKK
ncbi:hypothetical protein [Methanocella sp. MCL-LM]|uniref:hypothetical protein n=1 Tax=Methanocella sp. MCL-LM TaxID=3412035 RepID=UPI003C70F448